jgi:hypothetical protein
MDFSQWDDDQLRRYMEGEVIALAGSSQEKESNEQEYGPVYGGWLNQLLGLIELQERHRFFVSETKALAKAAFRSYVRKYAPKVEQQAIRYRQRVATEAAEAARLNGERLARDAARRAVDEAEKEKREAADLEKRYADSRAWQAEAAAELEAARARLDAAYREAQIR